MKKILGLILIVLVLAGVWHVTKNTANTPIPTNESESADPISDNPGAPEDATFELEEVSVTLKNGSFKAPVEAGSAIEQETMLLNEISGVGDINRDGKNDRVVLLVQSGGGTGVFFYVAGFISTPGAHRGTNAVFLGNRISPQSVIVSSNGQVTVNYLDRNADEPLNAEPTIEVSRTFVYLNNRLVEAE